MFFGKMAKMVKDGTMNQQDHNASLSQLWGAWKGNPKLHLIDFSLELYMWMLINMRFSSFSESD